MVNNNKLFEIMITILQVLHDYAAFFITFIIIMGSIFCIHYYFNIVRLPMLTCGSSEFKSFLKKSMPILSEKYWPTIWCYESRIQSALAYFLCPGFNVRYEREILTLDDGGQLALDWTHAETEEAPIIIILPGITGSSAEGYVKRFVVNARDCHFRCVVFNLRGLARDLDLKTPKLSCVTDTTDTVQVVNHIRKRFPRAVIGACGISLGALILAHYLIQQSHSRDVSVAMLNCTPFDVFVAANSAESGLEIIFNKVVIWRLLNMVKRFKHVFDTYIDKPAWDMEKVMKSRTIREFDDRLIGKMFGYKSVHEYYKDAMLVDKMDKIKIPVLCLSAADDMFQPLKYSEDDTRPLFDSDKVAFVITTAGGHIGHLEGWIPFWKKKTYQLRVFTQFFSAMFKNDSFQQFLPVQST